MAEEKRLIDADLYDEFLTQYAEDLHEIDAHMIAQAIEQCQYRLKAQPTVDAVEVVRCKDCKRCAVQHNHITLRYQLFCTHGKGYPEVSADDFCSYGERREGNG